MATPPKPGFGQPLYRRVSTALIPQEHSAPLRLFDKMILGKNRGNVLFPEDPLLSAEHVRFSLDPQTGLVFCEDLGSDNGTRLNKQILPPFTRHLVAPGDKLEIGSQCFHIEERGVIRK